MSDHTCPICLDNADNALVNGSMARLCTYCGQMFCGECSRSGRIDTCPMCRSSLRTTSKETFENLWKLIHDRSPGRHTLIAQQNIGACYELGMGVERDRAEAEKWYKRSAEGGNVNGKRVQRGLMVYPCRYVLSRGLFVQAVCFHLCIPACTCNMRSRAAHCSNVQTLTLAYDVNIPF